MKKLLLPVLVLLLTLTLLTAAAEAPEALCRIVLRTQEGDTTLGTGVVFGAQKSLLTVRGCWAEGELVAIGQDGEHAVTYKGEIAGSQLIMLGLATPSSAVPLTVTQSEYLEDYNLYGATPTGGLTGMEITLARTTLLDMRAEALLTAQEGLLPGAVMLGADGGLACISVSQHGEGEGVYTVIADVTLNKLFNDEPASAEQEKDAPQVLAPTPTPVPPPASGTQEGPRFLYGFRVEAANGVLTVDWSDALTEPAAEGTVFCAFASIITNPFLSFHDVADGGTTAEFPAVPGTQVMVWVVRSDSGEAVTLHPTEASQVQFVNVPEAAPFTAYGFRNLRCGLTCGAPGQDGMPADFLPQVPLTRENLAAAEAFYFQTEDTYQVEVEDDNHMLLVSVYMPDGDVYFYQSGYIFMPEMNGSDLWAADITAVFEDYARFTPEEKRWPAGEYTVLYSIDGCEAARFTFTLD